MLYMSSLVSIIEVLILTIPVLLSVAFVTVAERKTMASMQRRVGPNSVGYYGLLQAFADALKLILKEYVSPTQANLVLFFFGPIITLIFSLLGYAIIPYAPGFTLFDFDLGILYLLAVSSLATYGILLAGWSANSKYAFLGSLRSTAQLISYELILTSAILVVVLLTSSLNFTVNIEYQKCVWFVIPLFPLFYIFFISSIAETNRAPFDLAEAESELVSGFMTEHSAVIFVFFFLAEYASLVLMSIIIAILFLGGYNMDLYFISYIYDFFYSLCVDIYFLYHKFYYFLFSSYDLYNQLSDAINNENFYKINFQFEPEKSSDNWITDSIIYTNYYNSFWLGIKSLLVVFAFIWVRASYPRIRFDQLMLYCWTELLPIVFAFIILVPSIIYSLKILPVNIVI